MGKLNLWASLLVSIAVSLFAKRDRKIPINIMMLRHDALSRGALLSYDFVAGGKNYIQAKIILVKVLH